MQLQPFYGPRYIQLAFGELGEREIPGDRHNPRILEYGKAVRLKVTSDEVAWCSCFANWCVTSGGIVGTQSAAARSWLTWGREAHDLELGVVAVWSRGEPSQGHVNFPIGIAADGRLACIGGNQGNQVSIGLYDRSRLLSLRLPL